MGFQTNLTVKRARKASNVSFVWRFFRKVNVRDLDQMDELKAADAAAFDVFNKVHNNDGAEVYCCAVCFADPERTLAECLKQTQKASTTEAVDRLLATFGL